MTFKQSVSTCLAKFITFSGRASRSEYWWFYLFTFLVGVCAGVVDKIAGTKFISGITNLALFLPGLAVAVRRCHDTNHSGWWVICPIYNIVLMFFASDPEENDYGKLEETTEEE